MPACLLCACPCQIKQSIAGLTGVPADCQYLDGFEDISDTTANWDGRTVASIDWFNNRDTYKLKIVPVSAKDTCDVAFFM
jgi:hypothetical protein